MGMIGVGWDVYVWAFGMAPLPSFDVSVEGIRADLLDIRDPRRSLTVTVITNIEDPKFDLEKLINYYTTSS
jgi:hypothetical protein